MGVKEDEIKLLIERAQQKIDVASNILKIGYLEDAINRAYYAVFYAALAALLSKNIVTRKHSTTLSLFGYHIVRTGDIEKEYARIYRKLKEMRESADYDICVFFDRAEVEDAINQADKFVCRIKKYLEDKGIKIH